MSEEYNSSKPEMMQVALPATFTTKAVLFFLRNWKLFGFLTLVILSGAAHWYQHVKIKSLNAEIKSLEVDVHFYTNEANTCKAQFKSQSDAIKRESDKSKNNQKEVDNLKNEFDIIDSNSQTRIQEILAQPTAESCTDAMNFLRKYLR